MFSGGAELGFGSGFCLSVISGEVRLVPPWGVLRAISAGGVLELGVGLLPVGVAGSLFLAWAGAAGTTSKLTCPCGSAFFTGASRGACRKRGRSAFGGR